MTPAALKELLLAQKEKGFLAYRHPGGTALVPLAEFVHQPADGILYDLNRLEEVILSFVEDPKWVNDFAMAQVIRELHRLAFAPIDMVLYCPRCGTRHIDKADEVEGKHYPEEYGTSQGKEIACVCGNPNPNHVWTNPPHRTHRCADCSHEWRPSDHPTNGVAGLASGKNSASDPNKVCAEVLRLRAHIQEISYSADRATSALAEVAEITAKYRI